MEFNAPAYSGSTSTITAPAPSGLSDEHRAAMGQAFAMISGGHTTDAAADHLVANGMPRIVAKVLVKQYDRRC